MSREEIIAVIKETAAELGHVPTINELRDLKKVKKHEIRSRFGTYKAVLAACGLERSGPGYELTVEALFKDWAGVVRRLERLPTVAEYELYGKHSTKAVTRHFGGWGYVPAGMAQYARERGITEGWEDVMEAVARHLETAGDKAQTSAWATAWTSGRASMRRMMEDEPVYGPSILGTAMLGPGGVELPMLLAPTNEQGVIVLFGAVARKLGFVLLRIQTEYPDGEALREVAPERWQRIRLEFEYESRNFLVHGHDPAKCKVIVCWRHNWEDCPLEVVELSKVFSGQQSAFS